MKRHPFDPISLIFGVFFGAIALMFLLGDIDVTRIDQPWVVALPILVIGLILAGVGFRATRSAAPSSESDEEPN